MSKLSQSSFLDRELPWKHSSQRQLSLSQTPGKIRGWESGCSWTSTLAFPTIRALMGRQKRGAWPTRERPNLCTHILESLRSIPLERQKRNEAPDQHARLNSIESWNRSLDFVCQLTSFGFMAGTGAPSRVGLGSTLPRVFPYFSNINLLFL